MKILIIEDEKELRLTLRQFLEEEHFLVETAKDYTSGLSKLADYDYDCILLDIIYVRSNTVCSVNACRECIRMDRKRNRFC